MTGVATGTVATTYDTLEHTTTMKWLPFAALSVLWLGGVLLAMGAERPLVSRAWLARGTSSGFGYALAGLSTSALVWLAASGDGLTASALPFGVCALAGCAVAAHLWRIRIVSVDERGFWVQGWFRRTHVRWESIDHVALGQAMPWLIVRLRGAHKPLRATVSTALVAELSTRLQQRLASHRLDPALAETDGREPPR